MAHLTGQGDATGYLIALWGLHDKWRPHMFELPHIAIEENISLPKNSATVKSNIVAYQSRVS